MLICFENVEVMHGTMSCGGQPWAFRHHGEARTSWDRHTHVACPGCSNFCFAGNSFLAAFINPCPAPASQLTCQKTGGPKVLPEDLKPTHVALPCVGCKQQSDQRGQRLLRERPLPSVQGCPKHFHALSSAAVPLYRREVVSKLVSLFGAHRLHLQNG